MKALITQGVIALAIFTSFTVSAEAFQPVAPSAGISITSTISAVGVLAGP
jgi:hypothetical protein